MLTCAATICPSGLGPEPDLALPASGGYAPQAELGADGGEIAPDGRRRGSPKPVTCYLSAYWRNKPRVGSRQDALGPVGGPFP
jgi:hypothetical protein